MTARRPSRAARRLALRLFVHRASTRLVAATLTGSLLFLAAACSSGAAPGGVSAPSTIASGSPWNGSLVSVTLPPPDNSLRAVTCATARACWAVGSNVGVGGAPNGAIVVATTDGGRTWTNQTVPPTVAYLTDVACADARRCVAVGQSGTSSSGPGAVIATTDGGTIWTAQVLPPAATDVTAATCLPTRQCVAIATTAGGAVALTTSAPGAAWRQAGALPTGQTGATSVSCPDASHCWAAARTPVTVDRSAAAVAASSDGGTTWTALTIPPGVGALDALACFDTGDTTSTTTTAASSGTTSAPGSLPVWCAAVGTTDGGLTSVRSGKAVVLTTADGGSVWTRQPVFALVAGLTGLSCLAPGTCAAAGTAGTLVPQAGMALFTDPSSSPWKKAAVVATALPLTGISCVSTSACVAVGESITEHLAGG